MPYLTAMPRGKRPDPLHYLNNSAYRRAFLAAAIANPCANNSPVIRQFIKSLPPRELYAYQMELTQLGFWDETMAHLAARTEKAIKTRQNSLRRKRLFLSGIRRMEIEEGRAERREQRHQRQRAEIVANRARLTDLSNRFTTESTLLRLKHHQVLAARSLCKTALTNMQKGVSFKNDHEILDVVPEALLVLHTHDPDDARYVSTHLQPRLASHAAYQRRTDPRRAVTQPEPSYKTPSPEPMLPGE